MHDMQRILAWCLVLLAVAGKAKGELLVGLSRGQVRAVPDGIVSKLIATGRFDGLAVRSTADVPLSKPVSNASILLVVPNDYIEQFSELPSPALDDWVTKEVRKPLAQGYRITTIQLGEAPLSALYGARFWDSMPAALRNLAGRVSPLGIRVLASVELADLSASYPPSAGRFSPDIAPALSDALSGAGGLSLEAYPFLLALEVTDPATFTFLAMDPDAQGFWDDGGNLWYDDVLSSIHDAAVYALEALGFGNASVTLKTGWPTDGVARATPELASTFLSGLVRWADGAAGSLRPNELTYAVFRELLTEEASWARRWAAYTTREPA